MPSSKSPVPVEEAVPAPAQERLYISPFDQQILKTLLPTIHSHVSDSVSFQTLQTFPENSYGYVSLDTQAAQALKKKYNGAYLRGAKMRIDESRPEKKRKRTEQQEDETGQPKKGKKREKHAKLAEDVLPAVELPEGRHVKRGWTESAKAKGDSKKHKSKGEFKPKEKGQLAFRTEVPGKTPKSEATPGSSSTRSKSKKKLDLVEFDKTTQFPSFLKQAPVSRDGIDVTFVEDKGWVDADGKLVEAVSSRKSKRIPKALDEGIAIFDGVKSLSVHKSSPTFETENKDSASEDEASSALSSSSASSESSMGKRRESSIPSPTSTIKATKSRMLSLKAESASAVATLKSPLLPSTEAATPNSAIPPTPDLPTAPLLPAVTEKQVHPLEALFKRPAAPPPTTASTSNGKPQRRPAPAPINTSFGFGFDLDNEEAGSDDDNDESRVSGAPPQTPFTQRDRFNRSIRSAAPTPDTAAIGRRFSWREFGGRDDDDEDDADPDAADEDASSNIVQSREANVAPDEEQEATAGAQEEPADGKSEQNEFEKHFYAHRGEYNKAWKARRSQARKEVRQAENRRVGVGR